MCIYPSFLKIVKIKMITKTKQPTILVYFFNLEEKSPFFFVIPMSPALSTWIFTTEVKVSLETPNDYSNESLNTDCSDIVFYQDSSTS